MWSFLQNIKNVLCSENFTQEGVVCKEGINTTSCFTFNKNIDNCFNIKCGDTLEVVIQKIHNYLCSPEQTVLLLEEITNNTSFTQEFIQIINSVVSCQEIFECTTTTTTEYIPDCEIEGTAEEIII